MQTENLFEFNARPSARGHQYKLYKKHSASQVRAIFFCEHVVNVWNSLPSSQLMLTLVHCLVSDDQFNELIFSKF